MPKLFSTRRKSAKQLLGITSAKRSFSRKTGIGRLKAAMKPRQTLKRKVKRAAGYESAPMRALRNAGKRRYLFGIIPLGRKKR
ncbi:MAG: hypothetical protein K8I60_22235 [Anaerolineae bacterium]|nr:hypothetical protein [Anaerolineae bacterium]